MIRFKTTHFRILGIFVLFAGLTLTSCKDSSTSAIDEEAMKPIGDVSAEQTSMSASTNNANSSAAGLVIDSFDKGSQQIVGSSNGTVDVYSGIGPIGNMRELLGDEGHPVTSTHIISGTAPGENRITWSNSYGATAQELRYGKCIDPNQTRSDRSARFMHALAECTNPNSSELNADFSGMGGIDIDFVNLIGGAAPNYWRVVVVLQTGTGGTFRYDNASVPYQQGPFTLSIPFSEFSSVPTALDLADVDGIALAMGNNGNMGSPRDIAISEIRAVAGSSTQTNVYISDSNTDTYDPVFPEIADPNWASTVCYQGNSFGINAIWSNPHKAFEVGPHGWDTGTFDAEWINAVNTISSTGTVDSDDNSGPNGHNWTRYDKQVAGDGDFVIQLLADNCSWVYLADENGNSPQLVGYQGAVSTPGEYGVALDGNHTLTFIIYDGGGAAGGKFRLETTENPPPPIEPTNQAPVANAGADQTIEATGTTTSVTLDGSGSSDPDGDALTYSWSNGDSGVSTTVNLGVGSHTFTLTVTDVEGATDSDEVVVEITDNTAPELSFSQETSNLWPPNHKMVLVATGISATDIVDGSTDVMVTVSSNEASNGRGDGNTDSDYEIVTNPDGSKDVYVRAERSGKGQGRTYTISMSTSDVAGNSASGSFEVQVAKSQGRGR